MPLLTAILLGLAPRGCQEQTAWRGWSRPIGCWCLAYWYSLLPVPLPAGAPEPMATVVVSQHSPEMKEDVPASLPPAPSSTSTRWAALPGAGGWKRVWRGMSHWGAELLRV